MADLIKNGMHGCSAAENYVPPKDELLRERRKNAGRQKRDLRDGERVDRRVLY